MSLYSSVLRVSHDCLLVQVEFCQVVMPLRARRNHFINQIRRSFTAFIVQLVRIAYDGNTRFYHSVNACCVIVLLFEQPDGKRRRVRLTFLPVQIICNLAEQFPACLLVRPRWRRQHVRLPLYQLDAFLFIPRQIICICVDTLRLESPQCHPLPS